MLETFEKVSDGKKQLKGHLVEISLQQKLLEDVDEFGHRRKSLLEVLDQLHRPQPVGHVEADVDLDVRQAVRQLDDRDLVERHTFFKTPHS
jgi:hypothetical protein